MNAALKGLAAQQEQRRRRWVVSQALADTQITDNNDKRKNGEGREAEAAGSSSRVEASAAPSAPLPPARSQQLAQSSLQRLRPTAMFLASRGRGRGRGGAASYWRKQLGWPEPGEPGAGSTNTAGGAATTSGSVSGPSQQQAASGLPGLRSKSETNQIGPQRPGFARTTALANISNDINVAAARRRNRLEEKTSSFRTNPPTYTPYDPAAPYGYDAPDLDHNWDNWDSDPEDLLDTRLGSYSRPTAPQRQSSQLGSLPGASAQPASARNELSNIRESTTSLLRSIEALRSACFPATAASATTTTTPSAAAGNAAQKAQRMRLSLELGGCVEQLLALRAVVPPQEHRRRKALELWVQSEFTTHLALNMRAARSMSYATEAALQARRRREAVLRWTAQARREKEHRAQLLRKQPYGDLSGLEEEAMLLKLGEVDWFLARYAPELGAAVAEASKVAEAAAAVAGGEAEAVAAASWRRLVKLAHLAAVGRLDENLPLKVLRYAMFGLLLLPEDAVPAEQLDPFACALVGPMWMYLSLEAESAAQAGTKSAFDANRAILADTLTPTALFRLLHYTPLDLLAGHTALADTSDTPRFSQKHLLTLYTALRSEPVATMAKGVLAEAIVRHREDVDMDLVLDMVAAECGTMHPAPPLPPAAAAAGSGRRSTSGWTAPLPASQQQQQQQPLRREQREQGTQQQQQGWFGRMWNRGALAGADESESGEEETETDEGALDDAEVAATASGLRSWAGNRAYGTAAGGSGLGAGAGLEGDQEQQQQEEDEGGSSSTRQERATSTSGLDGCALCGPQFDCLWAPHTPFDDDQDLGWDSDEEDLPEAEELLMRRRLAPQDRSWLNTCMAAFGYQQAFGILDGLQEDAALQELRAVLTDAESAFHSAVLGRDPRGFDHAARRVSALACERCARHEQEAREWQRTHEEEEELLEAVQQGTLRVTDLFAHAVERLRPGLLAALPDSWGRLWAMLQGRVSTGAAGGGAEEKLVCQRIALLALKGLGALGGLQVPLQLLRLSYCVAAGAHYNYQRRLAEETQGALDVMGTARELFCFLALVPSPRAMQPEPTWVQPGSLQQLLREARLVPAGAGAAVEQLVHSVGLFACVPELASTLAACVRQRRRAGLAAAQRPQSQQQQQQEKEEEEELLLGLAALATQVTEDMFDFGSMSTDGGIEEAMAANSDREGEDEGGVLAPAAASYSGSSSSSLGDIDPWVTKNLGQRPALPPQPQRHEQRRPQQGRVPDTASWRSALSSAPPPLLRAVQPAAAAASAVSQVDIVAGSSCRAVVESLLRVAMCRPFDSVAAATVGLTGVGPLGPVSVRVMGPEEMVLTLAFLCAVGPAKGGDACPLCFQPKLVGAEAAPAAAAPAKAKKAAVGPTAKRDEPPVQVLLEGIQKGVVPYQDDAPYKHAFEWNRIRQLSSQLIVKATSKYSENLKLVRNAMLNKRLGAFWIRAEGVEGVQRALKLAAQIVQEMQEKGLCAYATCDTLEWRPDSSSSSSSASSSSAPAPTSGDLTRAARQLDILANNVSSVNLLEARLQQAAQEDPAAASALSAWTTSGASVDTRALFARNSAVLRALEDIGDTRYNAELCVGWLLAALRDPARGLRQGLQLEVRLVECERGRPDRPVLPLRKAAEKKRLQEILLA